MFSNSKITALVLIALVLTGFGCGNDEAEIASAPIQLNVWGVFDDEDNYDDVVSSYRTLHPNVSIEYREFRFDEYEEELIRALAEGEGPDVFLVHNTWVEQYKSLMQPMPKTITIGYQEVRGRVKKEVVNILRTENTLSERSLKSDFVDVVAQDVIRSYQANEDTAPEDRIFGLPMALDTIALYWNKDLFNAAGIAEAPDTWDEFQEAVIALTKVDKDGNIVQSGVGMGTSENVERASDLLALLMLQNGTEMISSNGRDVTFDKVPSAGVKGVLPGLDATRFYTDFANPTKEVYTWNADQPNSFDAFANGTSAMFFGYAYNLPLLRTTAPKINFAISQVPQIDGGRQANFANYFVMVVSKDSKKSDWAWDFIQYISADEEQNAKYLDSADKPPALRSLISTQLEDEDLSAFASEVLTARSWYHGNDIVAAEEALLELVDTILAGSIEPVDAIELSAQKVEQTL
ncbi:MAG: extracellular solute-binding protein [Patescibacteria group bacterium]